MEIGRMKSFLCALFLCGSLFVIAPSSHASDPLWWTAPETKIKEGVADNKAPVLVGQLKHVAVQAKKHLDGLLPGGAGPAIDAMVDSFGSDSNDNYAPVLLGQLKYVAAPFYARLAEVGYDAKANLIAHGYPLNWTSQTPWEQAQAPGRGNWAPAMIGQLKMVFSFDLTGYEIPDTDGQGLPDWWQMQHFGQLGNNPNLVGDDGQTLLQEFQNGTDPHKLDNPLVDLKVNVIVR